jgi:hypothetical protein
MSTLVVVPGDVIPGEERTKDGGVPPPVFPGFTVDTPSDIQLGGWSGTGPGPNGNTGLPTGTVPGPPPEYGTPEPEPGEEQGAFMERCETALTGVGVDPEYATSLCETAWANAQAASAAAAPKEPPPKRRRKT